jgi:hypothetical protein
MTLSDIDGNEKKLYKLSFLGVSTIYFVGGGSSHSNFGILPSEEDYDEEGYLELSSINILENMVGTKVFPLKEESSKYWQETCVGEGNILLEIINSPLILEAKAIELNGKTYTLTEN